MKAKFIYNYLMISIAALLLGSCSSPEAEAKFDENATDRLSGRQKELNDLLLSSSEGWKAVYYTDSTQLGGWTHLFKFLPQGNVDMASDFSDTGTYRSQYNIQTGSTVSLVFTTKNRIHLLSDAANSPTTALYAKGYLGDFQFYYYGQKNGDIIFKTNRNGHFLRFAKATAQDWTDLPKNVPVINGLAGDASSPLFRLLQINDGTTTKDYQFDYNAQARFATGSSLDPAVKESYDFAFSFNPTGAFSKLPLEVKGQKLANYIFDPISKSFTATGTGGVAATIKFTNKPLLLTDDYKILLPANANVVYGHDRSILTAASTNSTLFLSLFKDIEASMPAGTTLLRVQPWFNTPNGSYVEYRFSNAAGVLTRVYHFFTLSVDETKKVIILTPTPKWTSGATFASALPIPAPANLKAMDDQLMNPAGLYFKKENFTVGATNTVFTFTSASSPFRMTTWAFQ
jgi:hypothetical protein